MVKVIKDIVFAFIEKWSSRINVWAWDKRWKERKHQDGRSNQKSRRS